MSDDTKYINHSIKINSIKLGNILRAAGYEIPIPNIHQEPNESNAHQPKTSTPSIHATIAYETYEEENNYASKLEEMEGPVEQISFQWTTVYPGKEEE
tara:strand:+ start:262 stop:555 length:294 start_codon:yes stop_codon:yes gene_type:complete